jgi:membrane protease subunit (stomatin/prohibitin family)
MSLWNKVSSELVDIIEYVSSDLDVLVYRFPRYQNQIKYGAKLIVREGQGAIFVNEGKLADVFTPGTYTLETGNLPVLSTLSGWKYGFNSPFKAEVYFYTTRTLLNQQWGTQQPITMELPKYGLGEVRAYGQVSYKITDATVFFRQVVGTSGFLNGAELLDYLRGVIVSQFSEALTLSHPTVEQLVGGMSMLDDTTQKSINAKVESLGFQLTQFLIESLSLPQQLNDEIFEYSRLNNINISKLTQLKTAKAIEEVAQNPNAAGGMAGLGVQMGVGMAAAQGVMQAMQQMGINKGATIFTQMPTSVNGVPVNINTAPPPLPSAATATFHVAIDGQAQGPLDADALHALATQGKMTASTLVWQPGMAGWQAAASVPALTPFFQQQPPPLP